MEPKKQRGRPKGTVIPTDRKALNAVADLILREPTLRPTTAIKRVVPNWTDSVVHRLIGKWRKEREALIAEAQQREDVRAVRRNSAGAGAASYSGANIHANIRHLYDNQAVRAAREFANSPAIKAMQAMMDSPAMKAMREMHDSPAFRMVREMQNSPEMRMIREIQNSPVMKIMREQQRIQRLSGW